MRAGWFLILSCAAACSEQGSTTSGQESAAASPSQIRTFCDAQCDRSSRCSQTTADPGCTDDCVGDLGAIGDHLRADVVTELTRCFDTLECSVNDDICLERAYEAVGGDVDAALHSADVQACLDKHAECEGTSSAFSDDLCGTSLLLIDSQREAAFQCMERPCAEIPSCLTPIVGG